MKREDRQMILIYILIFLIIVLLVFLTKIVIENKPKQEPKQSGGEIQKIEINPYPTVNEECTFSVTLDEYNKLTAAGCQGGYTRYDISDININGTNLKTSVIYSDLENSDTKTINEGLFINDKKMTSIVDNVANIKFGIFDNKLFVHDMNNNESNALAFDVDGKQVYNLKKTLEENKIKDLSSDDININSESLDKNSFRFQEGIIEFNSVSNNCQNGEKAKGSHYKVTYSGEKFELPEFMSLVNCQ